MIEEGSKTDKNSMRLGSKGMTGCDILEIKLSKYEIGIKFWVTIIWSIYDNDYYVKYDIFIVENFLWKHYEKLRKM